MEPRLSETNWADEWVQVVKNEEYAVDQNQPRKGITSSRTSRTSSIPMQKKTLKHDGILTCTNRKYPLRDRVPKVIQSMKVKYAAPSSEPFEPTSFN